MPGSNHLTPEAKARVADLHDRYPELTRLAIAKRMNISLSTVHKILGDLKKAPPAPKEKGA